eukprot:TRINITY_DN54446_c0_g1_i2.p1 TRINITY_DN54446_c0_g1~~TRINITY_DN54446_c0_g1_i2.p1  ORF type:complete len:513 (+),score=100.18 TRINITY_DN54446_c0_g1_i2:85-1539(+)
MDYVIPNLNIDQGSTPFRFVHVFSDDHNDDCMDYVLQPNSPLPGAHPGLLRCFSPTVLVHSNLATFPRDVMEHVCHFSSFVDVVSLMAVCKRLRRILSDSNVFIRLARARWQSGSGHDKGTGPLVPLDFSKLSESVNVQKSCLAREVLLKRLTVNPAAAGNSVLEQQLTMLVNLNDIELDDWQILLQALRILVEQFDDPSDVSLVRALGRVEVSSKFVRVLLLTVARNMSKDELLTLAIKCIGLLSHNERNRQLFPSLGAVELIVASLEGFDWDTVLLQNALWALVIIARPLGSSEGSPYIHNNDQSIKNVAEIMRGGGISTVLNIIKRHYEDPEILAKGFWCLVNLALINANKDEIIEKGGLEYIIDRMLRFSHHHEVQHRGCFALINLSIPGNIKDKIRELGGIQAIIAALRNFPQSLSLVRCACNVLISLCWESPANRTVALNNSVTEVLQTVQKSLTETDPRMSGHSGAVTLVATALQFF